MRSLEANRKRDGKWVDMYLSHCGELFSLFQEPSSASRELVLPVWLEQVDSMQPLACELVRAKQKDLQNMRINHTSKFCFLWKESTSKLKKKSEACTTIASVY